MKMVFLAIAISFGTNTCFAQTASDILEQGLKITDRGILVLRIENKELKYQSYYGQKTSFIKFDDASYFLCGNNANIWIMTPNPLNYSISATISYSADQISANEDKALKDLISALKPVAGGGGGAAAPGGVITFANITSDIDNLAKQLNNDDKKTISEQLTKLKSIDFSKAKYSDILTSVGAKIDELKEKYKGYQEGIDNITNNIATYNEPIPAAPASPAHDEVLAKKVFAQQVKDLSLKLATQLKWIANIVNARNMVIDAETKSTIDDGVLLTQVTELNMQAGKIATAAIVLNEDGLQLSTDNDIIVVDKKIIITKNIKFRHFKRFVFEVAAGTAFTFLEYPKFGTATNALGQTIVANAGNDSFRRLNLTAMFNWNYYIQDSNIIPFVQLGIGANTQYPALFTGGGFRFASDAKTRIAISGGFASSWVRSLNDLKIGDVVTGTSEIDKDITYIFHWPLKPYIGIQLSF